MFIHSLPGIKLYTILKILWKSAKSRQIRHILVLKTVELPRRFFRKRIMVFFV